MNTQCILKQINPTADWRSKLRKIRTDMGKYDELDEQKRPAGEQSILPPILPTYWEVFHTHNIYRIRNEKLPKQEDNVERLPRYDIGIFLVGYSSLPIVLSLAEIQPCEKVYFLYSEGTKDILYEIDNRLKVMLKDSNRSLTDLVETAVISNLDESAFAIDDPSDPVATFKRIKEIIDSIDEIDNKRIALDLTGGKKTMIGGGFTAGAIWASKWSAAAQELVPFCDMFYIDSLKYEPKRGSPEPGTEFLSRLDNPYDVYNVQSNLEAQKLFEKHNYEAAASLWSGVRNTLEKRASQYGLEMEREKTRNQYRMTNCYYLWDSFYYETAKKRKKNHGDSWGYSEKHVRGSIDILDILSEVSDRRSLFENEYRVIHYAVDRYQNAVRRKESHKLDDAIVRFTQVIEMLCNYQIYRIASQRWLTDTSHNPVLLDVCLSEDWSITKLIHFLFRRSSTYDRRYQIANFDELLEISDYGCRNANEIANLIQPRNNFIHFSNRMTQAQTENNANDLQNLAQKFLENFSGDYCRDTCLSFDELLKLHEFRPL